MKKQVLILALGLLSLGTLQAQSVAQLQQPFGLPQRLRQELAKHGVATPADQRRTTARKPGSSTVYQWHQPTSQWFKEGMVVAYTYDGQGQVTQLVEADSATQQPSVRVSYTYNTAGLQISELEEEWNGSAWQNQSRSLNTFNSANALTDHLYQVWKNGAWENLFRTTVQYDARNHYTASLDERWRNGAWETMYASRASVTYTAAGAVLEETEEFLDLLTNTYRPGARRQYTYPSAASLEYSARVDLQWKDGAYVNQQRVANIVRDNQGRTTSMESELWENGAWQLSGRFSTTFLPNGSTRGLSEQRLNNAWVAQSRYSHTFDAFGNEQGYESETWANNVWSVWEGYRYLLRYNATNDLTGKVRQNYDPTVKTYVNALKYTYGDYRDITLGTKPNSDLAAQTQLYPNPTTGRVTLELPAQAGQTALLATEIMNSLGQVVQRHTVLPRQQATLDLGALPAGIYSVRLQTPAGLIVKKVVRQ